MRTIAFANQKGGVGKTTTVHNVGSALTDLGYKVLLVDLDPQASLTTLCLKPDVIAELKTTLTEILFTGENINVAVVPAYKDLDIVPCNTNLAAIEKMMSLADEPPEFLMDALSDIHGYDFVLIDCPPQLSQLTLNGLTAADEIIIPTQAEYLAIKGLEQLKKTIELVKSTSNAKLLYNGVIITKFRRNTTHTQEIKKFLNETEPLIGTVRESIKVSDSVYEDLPVVWCYPSHPTAIAYTAISKRIAGVNLTKKEENEIDE